MLAPQTRSSVAPFAASTPETFAPSTSSAPPGLTVTLPETFTVEVSSTASPAFTIRLPLTLPDSTFVKPTWVEHEAVASLPRLSTAVALTVFVPAVEVSIGIVPLGSTFRPDSSDAVTVATTPLWPTDR